MSNLKFGSDYQKETIIMLYNYVYRVYDILFNRSEPDLIAIEWTVIIQKCSPLSLCLLSYTAITRAK